MGTNYIQLNRWLKKPTWTDFIINIVLWGFVSGCTIFFIVTREEDMRTWQKVLYTLLISLFYIALFVSGYRHVKRTIAKKQKKNDNLREENRLSLQ